MRKNHLFFFFTEQDVVLFDQHYSAGFYKTCLTVTNCHIYINVQLISVSWYRHVSYEYKWSTQRQCRYRIPDTGMAIGASLILMIIKIITKKIIIIIMKEWSLSFQVSKTQKRIQQKGSEGGSRAHAGWSNPCQTDWDGRNGSLNKWEIYLGDGSKLIYILWRRHSGVTIIALNVGGVQLLRLITAASGRWI